MPQELISGSGAVEEDPLVYGSGPDTMVWCSLAGGSNMLTAYQNAAPEELKSVLQQYLQIILKNQIF